MNQVIRFLLHKFVPFTFLDDLNESPKSLK